MGHILYVQIKFDKRACFAKNKSIILHIVFDNLKKNNEILYTTLLLPTNKLISNKCYVNNNV